MPIRGRTRDARADEAARDREARRDEAMKDRRGKPVSERLKEKSHQTEHQAMNAAPDHHPAEPANAEAVYTTGPGQAVEYNYTRRGTYADEYAYQQQVQVAGDSVAGPGQIVTSGAANNPT